MFIFLIIVTMVLIFVIKPSTINTLFLRCATFIWKEAIPASTPKHLLRRFWLISLIFRFFYHVRQRWESNPQQKRLEVFALPLSYVGTLVQPVNCPASFKYFSISEVFSPGSKAKAVSSSSMSGSLKEEYLTFKSAAVRMRP
jgi:hypothetical protein